MFKRVYVKKSARRYVCINFCEEIYREIFSPSYEATALKIGGRD